jgi:hypothetical protein
VAAPGISDLLFVLSDQLLSPVQVVCAELVISRQLDIRIEPELRLAVDGLNMDVQSFFLA